MKKLFASILINLLFVTLAMAWSPPGGWDAWKQALSTYGISATDADKTTLTKGLLLPAGSYVDFGSTYGSTGYGIRESSGKIQFKHSGGTWADLGTGTGGSFLDLSDTPSAYTGAGGYFVKVKGGADGLEFASGSVSSHAFLDSAVHTDTATGSAVAGKFVIGNATPAWSASAYKLPTSVPSAGKILVSDGTDIVGSTPTFPNASATTRKIIVSDGTNWVASTETYAAPGTANALLSSDGTNWVRLATSANITTFLGSADYAAMRTALSLVPGTNVQVWDADLDYLSGFTPSDNVKTILNAADYAAIRTALGLVIGTNVQAYDADLGVLAGLTVAEGSIIVGNATPAWSALAKGTQYYPLVAGATTVSYAQLTAAGIANDTITATQLAATQTFSDGDFLDLSAITHTVSADEGLALPAWANVSPASNKPFISVSGPNLKLWDTVAQGWVTFSSTGSGAPVDAQYLVINSVDPTLQNERRFVDGAGLLGTDAGAGSTYTLAFAPSELTNLTWGAGSGFTWTFDAGAGTDPTFVFGNGTVQITGTLTHATPFTLGATSVTTTGAQLNYLNQATGTTGTATSNIVFSASPTFTGTPVIPTPFTLGATSVTATGAQLNYLSAATGTTGTASSNLVFSLSPTLTTPTLGAATATSINKVTITAPATSSTLTIANGSSLITSGAYAITLTATNTTGVTLPTSGTLYGTATGSITSAQLAASLSDEIGTAGYAVFSVSPTFTGTVTIPAPFTLGSTSVTATGTQLNYLASATGTTGTTSTNLVFSTSPTLVTPVLGVATATSINKVAITAPASGSTLTIADGKTLTVSNTITLTAGADSQSFAFPSTSGTVVTLAGGTFTGKITTLASATGGAGFNLPHGAAPTSPTHGDIWTTTAGLYARINGGTVGPFGTSTATIGGTLGTTDNAIPRADGTGGVTAQGSLASIDDTGNLNIPTGACYKINNSDVVCGGADGSYKAVFSNNTSLTPSGTENIIFAESNVMKFAQSGSATEYAFVGSPSTSQVFFGSGVTSGGVLYGSAANTVGSTGALTQYGVLIGGGAGAGPTAVTVGQNNQVFRGNTGAAPSFGSLQAADLPIVTASKGGTGIANNDLSTITISGNYATTFTVSNTTSVTLPTSGTLAKNDGSNMTFGSQAIGDLFYASSASAWARLAGVAAGQPLLSGGVATAPAYAGYTFSGTAAQTYTFPTTSATLTRTVASGAKALATSEIASAACSAAQTDTATGTLTTDTIIVSFNGDPTAVTGYVPLTTGMLTIIPYPTADTVNFKVCNNTSSAITPGAITLNWRVVR